MIPRFLRPRGAAALAAFLAFLPATACSPGGPVKSAGPAATASPSLDPPAAPGSLGPSLAAAGADLLLTWMEPTGDFASPTYRMRLARFARSGTPSGTGRWSAPVTVAQGAELYANWADFPGAVAGPGGEILAHWPVQRGTTHAAQLARSTDGGATWTPIGALQADPEAEEHGFVSLAAEEGGFRAFWLEGSEGGRMSLRSSRIAGGTLRPAELLDDRVCDCCQTGAAATPTGTVVVYRDRTEAEIRDISALSRTAAGWAKPVAVHADGWEISGCPVNGPAVAAAGRLLAVAWFTAALPGPRVELAFSTDAGASFGAPVVVDGAHPVGRVDVKLMAGGGALVSWVAPAGMAGTAGTEKTAIWLRRVRPDGQAGAPLEVPGSRSVRASGFPRLGLAGERALLAWGDDAQPSRLRATLVPIP